MMYTHPSKDVFRLDKTNQDILEELTKDGQLTTSAKEPSPLKFSLSYDPDYRNRMVRQYLGKEEFQYIGTEDR